jgi:hypothetical protein
VNYVREIKPQAIVAVACQKELEEGIHGVQELSGDDETVPLVVIIPLSKDGCVDTEVDEKQALDMISSDGTAETVKGGVR